MCYEVVFFIMSLWDIHGWLFPIKLPIHYMYPSVIKYLPFQNLRFLAEECRCKVSNGSHATLLHYPPMVHSLQGHM